jgi:hypothetical protein
LSQITAIILESITDALDAICRRSARAAHP